MLANIYIVKIVINKLYKIKYEGIESVVQKSGHRRNSE